MRRTSRSCFRTSYGKVGEPEILSARHLSMKRQWRSTWSCAPTCTPCSCSIVSTISNRQQHNCPAWCCAACHRNIHFVTIDQIGHKTYDYPCFNSTRRFLCFGAASLHPLPFGFRSCCPPAANSHNPIRVSKHHSFVRQSSRG